MPPRKLGEKPGAFLPFNVLIDSKNIERRPLKDTKLCNQIDLAGQKTFFSIHTQWHIVF